MAQAHGTASVESLRLPPLPAAIGRSSLPPLAQSALMLQHTAGNRAVTKLLGAPSHPALEVPVGVGISAAGSGVSVGRTLLAPELDQVVTESRNPRLPVSRAIGRYGTAAPQPVVQRKACKFLVYDSTERGMIGLGWRLGRNWGQSRAVMPFLPVKQSRSC